MSILSLVTCHTSLFYQKDVRPNEMTTRFAFVRQRMRLACRSRSPAENNFDQDPSANSCGASSQDPRMAASMKNRQYPDLVFSNYVVDTIELEPVYRRPP